jgi:hypothetical protein
MRSTIFVYIPEPNSRCLRLSPKAGIMQSAFDQYRARTVEMVPPAGIAQSLQPGPILF